jgi:hypothetical protein
MAVSLTAGTACPAVKLSFVCPDGWPRLIQRGSTKSWLMRFSTSTATDRRDYRCRHDRVTRAGRRGSETVITLAVFAFQPVRGLAARRPRSEAARR